MLGKQIYSLMIDQLIRKGQTTHILLIGVLVLTSTFSIVGTTSELFAQRVPINESNASEDEIVYVDANGCIRVWDPHVPVGGVQVAWESPECGFIDIALGDFNDDGDIEIAGLLAVGNMGKLIVYDPVLNSPMLTRDGTSNGIPWRKLYEETIPGAPKLIAAGNLNSGVDGEEIIYGYENEGSSTIIVLSGESRNHMATAWGIHIGTTFDYTWDAIGVGDVNGIDTDEVVLIDSGSNEIDSISRLHVYRVDTSGLKSNAPVFATESTDVRWRGAAIGEVTNGVPAEIIVFRSIRGVDLPTAFFLQYQPHYEDHADQLFKLFNEGERDRFHILKRPHWAFLADITGHTDNGQDDEVFFLREIDQKNSAQNRLIAMNRGNDFVDTDEVSMALDNSNEWRRGEGGNVDGSLDGKEEVILLAAEKLHIYRFEPSGEQHLKREHTLEVATNKKSLTVGDLDANGFSTDIVLQVESLNGSWEVQAGSQGMLMFQIVGPADGIPVEATIEHSQPWITNVNTGNGFTPSIYGISIDASGLLPGRYSIPIYFTSAEPRVDYHLLPSTIDFEVTPAQFIVEPREVRLVHFPCMNKTSPTQTTITLSSAAEIRYQAFVLTQNDFDEVQASLSTIAMSAMVNKVEGLGGESNRSERLTTTWSQVPRLNTTSTITWESPIWIDAVSATGAIEKKADSIAPSDTITITVEPAHLPSAESTALAHLMIVADYSTGNLPDNLRFIPIHFLCASRQVRIPLIYQENETLGTIR